jgi:hypothetical protein
MITDKNTGTVLTIPEVMAILKKQAHDGLVSVELDPHSKFDRMYDEVHDVWRDYQWAADGLNDIAKSVETEARRVIEIATHKLIGTINSLGELQAKGPAFDVACAMFRVEEGNAIDLIKNYSMGRWEIN